jgi:hypothetical protein
VYRYREKGTKGLCDLSKRQKRSPHITPTWKEILIVKERKETGYGPYRLSILIKEKHSLFIHPSTIKRVLRRKGFVRHKRMRKRRYQYYGWGKFLPLQFFQVDTKHILDAHTLPQDVYMRIKRLSLPLYQWTAPDVVTRMKFVAYSYEQTFANGLSFMLLLVCWLRLFGVKHPIYIQIVWGEEFAGKSMRKRNGCAERVSG